MTIKGLFWCVSGALYVDTAETYGLLAATVAVLIVFLAVSAKMWSSTSSH